ncbi:MAG: 3-deoxy-D-manno-octulosonic acid transferase [Pseudomonadota bacterium]
MSRPVTRSVATATYLGLSRVAGPLARHTLKRRLKAGKEDPSRMEERLGAPSLPRPQGKLVWFHAASVGEALSLLDLIARMIEGREDLSVLVTTVTRSSAEILGERLPSGAVHQFAPVDTWDAVGAFLDHWRPDLAVWTESELWPTLLHRTHAMGCPMVLINGRISQTSARKLARMGKFAGSLLSRFDQVFVQDDVGAARFEALGADPARLSVSGSLKAVASPLPVEEGVFKSLSAKMKGRTIWCAASTHPGEEMAALHAHRAAKRTDHALLMILAPRHPERADEIEAQLTAEGVRPARRSRGETPDARTEVFLADTLGEMGLWYRLAVTSFVGGSLTPIGGHNPYEPALLGSAILTGPHVANFRAVYDRLLEAKAAVMVEDAAGLARALADTINPARAATLASAAWGVSSEASDVIETVRRGLETLLDR